MQTLHLRFRALRAISLRPGLSRWRTPSMPVASKWKDASPLPNHPRANLAVGSPSDTGRAGMKGLPGLSNSPGPTSAVGSQSSTECAGPKDVPRLLGGSARSTAKRSPGAFPGSCLTPLRPSCALEWRPASRPPDGILCPVAGAGVPGAPRLRAARKGASAHCDGRLPVLPCRVCRWQTSRELPPYPALHEAGDMGEVHRQAHASAALWAAWDGLSFPLRLPRCEHALRPGARSVWEKTVGRLSDGAGTSRSEATVVRPTGRLKPDPFRKSRRQTSPLFCADTPPLVTGQEPNGTRVPDVAQRRSVCTLQAQLSSLTEEGAWRATTSQ